jgi:hypothetical protein
MENSANQLGSASKQSIKVKAEKIDVLTHVFASQVLEESAKRRRQRLSKVCDRTIVAKGDGKQTCAKCSPFRRPANFRAGET